MVSQFVTGRNAGTTVVVLLPAGMTESGTPTPSPTKEQSETPLQGGESLLFYYHRMIMFEKNNPVVL